jgi:glycosyltransferase involved in cell wall biosynthesis
MKVCHLTSVHPRDDIRIFVKQCRSLAAADYDVTLVVADGLGDEKRDGVSIIDAGASRGRFDRALNATKRVLQKAIRVDASIYHLHDPELLFAGLALKRRGKHVIFDSHEDIPQDILTKPYLPALFRPAISKATALVEYGICRRLDGVVAATPFIRDTFLARGIRCTDINNYPILGELQSTTGWSSKKSEACYLGSMTLNRGIVEMVDAFGMVRSDARLNLVGQLDGTDVEKGVKQSKGWSRVNATGEVDRSGVKSILERSIAGIVTFKPGPNHLESQPNKMFEYMSAGIPVIASNFPLWRKIVEENQCGLLVNPLDPSSIASAIDQLVLDPERARKMGENGSRAIVNLYNWEVEKKKLLQFYEATLAR